MYLHVHVNSIIPASDEGTIVKENLAESVDTRTLYSYTYLKVFGCIFDSFIAVKVLGLCNLRLKRASVEQHTATLVG